MTVTLTHTYTQVFNVITPANPYLRCSACGARVEFWYEQKGPPKNRPCGHRADYESICPSWGPVDGCQCQQHLGHVPHSAPPPAQTDHGKEQGPL